MLIQEGVNQYGNAAFYESVFELGKIDRDVMQCVRQEPSMANLALLK